MQKNIGYHTRLYSDNTRKITGGSYGGALDMETVNRLIKHHFNVVVKNSGTPVFVDREGREVTLYLTVDAGFTEKGLQALQEWRAEKRKEEALLKSEQEEIDQLLAGLSNEEIVRRLSR